jgi:hypothetical protein
MCVCVCVHLDMMYQNNTIIYSCQQDERSALMGSIIYKNMEVFDLLLKTAHDTNTLNAQDKVTVLWYQLFLSYLTITFLYVWLFSLGSVH